ncbi:MAG TPA: hypothetical protein VKV15_28035 [Bryobacteraceae bacterium]|nr:hypothetical protein [Bryobacteraceae bacterium]
MGYSGIAAVVVCGLLGPAWEMALAQAPSTPTCQAVPCTPFTLVVERSATAVNPNTGQHALTITVTNAGTKPAIACTIRLEAINENGEARSGIVLSVTKLLEVGQRWQHPRPIFVPVDVHGVERKYSVTVDYIRFADGLSWGPDISQVGKTFSLAK